MSCYVSVYMGIYGHIFVHMPIYGHMHLADQSTHHRVLKPHPAGCFSLANTHPRIFGAYILWMSFYVDFSPPIPGKKSKYCAFAQMTIPARTASKFCTKKRAALP